MNRLHPADLASFARKYRFAGGRLRRVTIRQRGSNHLSIGFELVVRTATRELGNSDSPVRLRFRLDGVDEYRFQKRMSGGAGKITDARFGYFGDVYFINLDAWGLEKGETPKLHDFRGSDAYVGGRELFWELVPAKP